MKRFVIILMALALGLSVSAQRGRYNKGRKPVHTTKRVTPRPATTIKTCPDNNHPHAIDLGLPSGTKWACCNVGATKPEEYGSSFAWGETSPKTNYDEDTYKWYKSEWVEDEDFQEGGYYVSRQTKYCVDSEYGYNGFTDNKNTLDLDDDAAHANWGSEWCMPDGYDFEELKKHTTNKWVNNFNGTGMKGYIFTASNGKRIFFPTDRDKQGWYWTNTTPHCQGENGAANTFFFDSDGMDYITDFGHVDRSFGHNVRPVICESTEDLTSCPDNSHPHAIDMGIAGVWACCNVGASKPEESGSYFAWGEINTKSDYDDGFYNKWKERQNWPVFDDSTGTSYFTTKYFITKYCNASEYGDNGFVDHKTTLDLVDDAAHAKWGGKWHMPTKQNFELLMANTSFKRIRNYNGKGVKGLLFTASNGNSIFLPDAGERWSTSFVHDNGSQGYYWSSSLYTNDPTNAYGLGYDRIENNVINYYTRSFGCTIRPMYSKN